jgi:hypothetical protein
MITINHPSTLALPLYSHVEAAAALMAKYLDQVDLAEQERDEEVRELQRRFDEDHQSQKMTDFFAVDILDVDQQDAEEEKDKATHRNMREAIAYLQKRLAQDAEEAKETYGPDKCLPGGIVDIGWSVDVQEHINQHTSCSWSNGNRMMRMVLLALRQASGVDYQLKPTFVYRVRTEIEARPSEVMLSLLAGAYTQFGGGMNTIAAGDTSDKYLHERWNIQVEEQGEASAVYAQQIREGTEEMVRGLQRAEEELKRRMQPVYARNWEMRK